MALILSDEKQTTSIFMIVIMFVVHRMSSQIDYHFQKILSMFDNLHLFFTQIINASFTIQHKKKNKPSIKVP